MFCCYVVLKKGSHRENVTGIFPRGHRLHSVKGVIRSPNSNKDRPCNCQKKAEGETFVETYRVK